MKISFEFIINLQNVRDDVFRTDIFTHRYILNNSHFSRQHKTASLIFRFVDFQVSHSTRKVWILKKFHKGNRYLNFFIVRITIQELQAIRFENHPHFRSVDLMLSNVLDAISAKDDYLFLFHT